MLRKYNESHIELRPVSRLATLRSLWEYAAKIQHNVPKDEAFDLLFKRIDEEWCEADQLARSN